MMSQEEKLKPEQMNALQRHIQQAHDKLAHQTNGSNEDDLGSLIYMGNVHDSFPRDLIKDPILNSEEIHTWMLMRLEISDQFSITRIPKQSTLQEQLKCSRPIVSRNLQVLRALRWITLCNVVKGPDGQYKGAIYAQHDEPLSLAETLVLDQDYIHFLETQAKGDVLKRLNHIKDNVLKHTNYRLLTEDDPLTELSQANTKLKKFTFQQSNNSLETTLACPPQVIEPNKEINLYNDQAIPNDIRAVLNDNVESHVKDIDMVKSVKSSVNLVNHHENRQNQGLTSHVKNIDMGNHVKNIDTAYSSSGSSSSFINTNTTTTANLRIPECLAFTDKTRIYSHDLARRLPPEQQQYILNFVEERFMAGQQGISTKVGNPVGLLKDSVERFLAGTFEPTGYGHQKLIEQTTKNKTKKYNYEREIRELAADIQNLDKLIESQPNSESKDILIDQRDTKQLDLEDLKRRLNGDI